MTTSFTPLPVANASKHSAALLDPANTQAAADSISSLDLTNSAASTSDDDVLTPLASSIPTNPFAAEAALSGTTSAAIPGVGGDPPLAVATSGSGLVFLNTFTADDTLAYENDVIAAEKQLEGLFTNNVTLRIKFDMANTVPGDTDGNKTTGGQVTVNYATLKAALLKLAPDDIFPTFDPSGGKGFTIPEAYARMLGLSTATPTLDATVTFNSTGQTWDFGQDVVNAITHGISEAGMGRDSGLGVANGDIWTPLDLFRYTGLDQYDDNPASESAFFSADGGRQTSASAGLFFNDGEHLSKTDPDDWQKQAVFGGNSPGETLTLTPTDLGMMGALGWTTSLQPQLFSAPNGDWETFSNWNNGYTPIAAEDVEIGYYGLVGANATLSRIDDNVTVNSLTLNAHSSLTIDNGAMLTATNGTVLNPADTIGLAGGNEGAINIFGGSTLTIGDSFENSATLNVGTYSGGFLDLVGDVAFYGKGAINLGGITAGVIADIAKGPGPNPNPIPPIGVVSTGEITGAGAMVNVDQTISGAGLISVASLDNQANASIGATIAMTGYALQIESSSIRNEGELFADAQTTLDLDATGGARSLVNSGKIDLAAGADLEVTGNLTAFGSGSLNFDGAGSALTSDSNQATSFTNDSVILATASAQIGDAGVKSVNDLTLVDLGSILAQGSGVTLTLNTGGHTIIDEGGLFEAEAGAQLTIDSPVRTGHQSPIPGGAPQPGPTPSLTAPSTIEAASGGVVNINAAIFDGLTGANQVNGRILINGGTVNVAAGVSLGVPVTFVGSGGALDLAKTPIDVEINGSGGAIALSDARADVSGGGFTVTETGADSLAIGGNGVSGAVDVVNGARETITTHASSHVTIIGGGDTVNVGVANALALEGENEVLNLHQLFGDQTWSGFGATDVMQFSTSDFADFQALMSHTTQSGADALITLDAKDVIKLTNVEASSLTASQFKFV